ncbi:transposase [Streptomyces sp. NPDC059218]|uniref:transposase n=1 Tax=unclassified Streptomyces TaxID=2593676 RepID=UPI0036836C19
MKPAASSPERQRESVTLEQIAADFDVHPITLSKWLRRADTDEGAGPAPTPGESAELREVRKRIRLVEQENEVLRRATPPTSSSLDPAGSLAYLGSRTWPGRA